MTPATSPATNTSRTPASLPLVPGPWTVDPFHSSVGFTIRHLGVSKVRGRFATFGAEIVIGNDLDTSNLAATVDLSSIDTGNSDRDAHVLSADILDVALRPSLTFRSEAIRQIAVDRYSITGQATIGDVTQPLALEVELGGIETFADGTRHAGFEATGELRRKDFGIGAAIPGAMLGDVIKLELDVQLIEPHTVEPGQM